MTREIAIIGDYFILPEVFERELRKSCAGTDLTCRLDQTDWPDTPAVHGYHDETDVTVKEYLGDFEEVTQFVGDAEVLVTHLSPITAEMLDRLPNLRLIACSRGGPVNIDIEAARARQVRVVRAPGRNATAVAEFTIGAILTETRKIRTGHEALRAGNWRGDLYRVDTTGRELNEMTVGVIGYGKIGTRVTKLLRAFGTRVLVCDPYVQLDPEDAAAGVEQVSLETLLEQSDVVTLHPRVSEETTHMINKDSLARMKPDALLVNTARGPLCNYDDLYEALRDGVIGSAMLETFSVEPTPPDWPLLQLDNVTLTPHIAGASVRTATYAAEVLAEDVRRYFAGEPLLNLC
ncbi:2-hydroxyacid dehydrogenase [Roseobacter sp.]|uniref:2-hydroxyacid dehydrogenase n=1 Tax=Roseobacter sp. TaxID=1907202 RepID=UPI00296729E5|nr:2-hydroxyacid dehydrogenase [Roseobacter sp.]MDW3182632.1 2-hydroxyacid dehydrogenase [Roseobacter sp.]